MLVRAKENCYLGEHGFHVKDEEFDYSGPKNPNLEPVKGKPAEAPESDAK